MNEHIVTWIVGCLIVSSILMWWFNTNLKLHLLTLLAAFYRRKNKEFWSVPMSVDSDGEDFFIPIDVADFTEPEFEEWTAKHTHPLLAELLSCPGCLSAHVSFWVAVCAQLVLWSFNPVLFVCCWLGWPAVANILLNMTKR